MKLFLSFVFGIISGLISSKLYNYFKNKSELKSLQEINKSIKNMIQETKEQSYYTIGPLNIRISNWLNIENKRQNGWTYNDLKFDENLKEYFTTIPKDLYNFIENLWQHELKIDPKMFNGPRYGLHSLKINKNSNSKIVPYLSFKLTDYKHFIGTNRSYIRWDSELKRKYFDYRIFHTDGYQYLEDSYLSNDLATATTIITNDDKVILTKRSKDVKILPNDIHTSIAEGIDPNKDKIDNKPNVFQTIIRGAREELGIKISLTDIKIIGIGIYFDYAQPFFLGVVKSKMTYDQLKKNSKKELVSWEGKCFDVPFNINSLAPFLFDRYPFYNIKTAELAKISIILCLIQKYGEHTLEKELYKINSIMSKRALKS